MKKMKTRKILLVDGNQEHGCQLWAEVPVTGPVTSAERAEDEANERAFRINEANRIKLS